MIAAVAVAPGLVLFGEGTALRTAHGQTILDPKGFSKPLGSTTTGDEHQIFLPDVVQDIVYADGRVYVAAGEAGLHILAVEQDGGLRPLGQVALAGEARGVAVTGTRAYVAADLNGLRIVDVSDPAQPVEVGAIDTGGRITAVATRPPYVYLADQNVTLRVVDAGDPTNPVVVHAITDSALTTDLTLDGARLLLATSHGLRVLSLADPARPQETGRFPADRRYTLYSVAVTDGRVFVGRYQRGVEEFIIDAEGKPALVCSACPDVYPDPSRANLVALAAADGLIYAADGDALTVLRYAPGPLQVVAARQGFTQPQAVAFRDRYAYVAAPYQGIMTLDTRVAPRLVSRVEPQADGYVPDLRDLVTVGEGLVVAAGEHGLFRLSLADPARPTLQAHLPLGMIHTVATAGERVYAAGGSTLYSLRLDSSAVLTATIPLTQVLDLTIAGDVLYVAGDGGLLALRWPEGGAPVELGCYGLPLARRVAVAGTTIVLAHNNGVDLLAPIDPKGFLKPLGSIQNDCHWQKLITLVSTGRPLDIATSGEYLYASYTTGEVMWYSLAEPTQPTRLASTVAPGYPTAVATGDGLLAVADATAGLVLWQPVLTRVWAPLLRQRD